MRSGFSTIKNGEKMGYPYLEAYASLAPLVDEMVIAVGDCEDNTRERLIEASATWPCPLRIIDSPWNLSQNRGGLELSVQTNVALEACQHDVCVYIQADEVIHEEDYDYFIMDLVRFEEDDSVSGLAFHWVHFYGDFHTVVYSKEWYRREMRAVKRSHGMRSFSDAQGFRILLDEKGASVASDFSSIRDLDVIDPKSGRWAKPAAALSRGRYFHYGWVKAPQQMASKAEELHRYWHGNAKDGLVTADNVFPHIFGMKEFQRSHPQLIMPRLSRFEAVAGDSTPFFLRPIPFEKKHLRLRADDWLEVLTDIRVGEFKNYKNLKKY